MLAVYPPTPVVATVETPERRAVVVAIDLATSDFLLRRGIDEFFARACEWLVERDARERQGQNTAEAIVVASEKNSRSFVLEAGKGVQPIRVAIAENSLAAGPVPAVGVWRLADAAGKVDAKSPTIPVSLLNAHESDLRSEPKEVALATSNLTIALWIWPALLGFALLVAEWVLFHRKITI